MTTTELIAANTDHHFSAPCDRCDGRGRGPSAPSGWGWWHDETELALAHAKSAAQAPDSWDGPGWDESDEVECPFCGGTGLVEIIDPSKPVKGTEDDLPF